MGDFFHRHSLFLTSLALLIVSFQLMSASIENRELPQLGGRVIARVIYPIETFHHEATQSVSGLWNHYVWLLDVEEERNDSIIRIKVLEEQNSRSIEFENENKRLRELLDFTQTTGHRGVSASVIGRDPSNWIRSVTIGRGAKDGLREGLAVVDGHALVGQTTVVTDNSSRVLLLTDTNSSIDAIVQRTRAPGIVEGVGSDELHFRYVIKNDEVEVGDRIIASGLDGVYPKGTLVGVVTAVNVSERGLFQEITVEPSVDLRKIETLQVIVPENFVAPQIQETPEELAMSKNDQVPSDKEDVTE